MICIKPKLDHALFCPRCAQPARADKTLIRSAFALADCVCENCGFEFYQTLPTGHTVINELAIDKSDGMLFPKLTPKTWLTEALLNTQKDGRRQDVRIQKIVYKKSEHVVILNTLDFLYGHVLLKLYNATYHLDTHQNLGLVIIAPKQFEWLIPQGCAEAWLVDLKLSELASNHLKVQEFILEEFDRYKTIYLSKAYSHPDFSQIDIGRFTRVAPFNLASFTRLRPTFTFVLREDRWWWRGLIDYGIYRLCRKIGFLKEGGIILSMRQNSLVKKTISLIRQKLPSANFFVVGLGTTGHFKKYARDERRNVVDDLVEKYWCKIYAQSHVVIGIHGSNLLLPTAHAASCLEILPGDRYGNIIQDISVRYADRRQLYFYRFTDQYSRPKNVAEKAISIIENFDVFEKNMRQNIYRSKSEATFPSGKVSDDIYAIH